LGHSEIGPEAANLFFKMPLIGSPGAERCSKRSFPHKGNSEGFNSIENKKISYEDEQGQAKI
jgi:hypothetical protein